MNCSMAARRRAFLEIVLTRAQYAQGDLAQIAAELEPLFGHDLGVTPPVVLKQVRAMGRWKVQGRLGELSGIPTLVVGAQQDLIARPPLYQATASAIPGARLVELKDAAHGVPATQPERINELLREHFTRVDGD